MSAATSLSATAYGSEIHDKKLQRDIEAISALLALPEENRQKFWQSRRGSLAGLTPVEALREGKRERVLTAAEAFVRD
jgi:hypothetical protein